MTPDQKEAARARMAKARAVRESNRQKKAVPIGAEPGLYPEVSGQEDILGNQPISNTAPDLVLTVRRLHIGSFTGLWELGRVNPDGTIKIITDANTKQIVINLARNEILRCGQ